MCCIAQVRGWLSRGEWGMLGVQGCGVPAFSLVLPTDSGFGARLLELCNQGLFECLALNLHCLGGQQMELAAVINGRIVSTTQPQRPSLLFSWVSILWYPVVFHFLLHTAIPYSLIPFKSWLRVSCSMSAFCPSASHVSWGESILGELVDHNDGTEASGGTGAHACRPRCHPQIRSQGW